MGICALSKAKLHTSIDKSCLQLSKPSQIRIKASARDLIALQSSSKSQGFHPKPPKPQSVPVIGQAAFSPQDFLSFAHKHSKFQKCFNMTNEFIEIKGKGFLVFGDPKKFTDRLPSKNALFLYSASKHSQYFTVKGLDVGSSVLMKMVILDPYNDETFDPFIKSFSEANSSPSQALLMSADLEHKDEGNHAPKQKTPEKNFPLNSCGVLFQKGEFWKSSVAHFQLSSYCDLRLDELLCMASKRKIHMSLDKINSLVIQVMILIKCLAPQSKPGISDNAPQPAPATFQCNLQNFGFDYKKRRLRYLQWEGKPVFNKNYYFSPDFIAKLGTDSIRNSLLLIVIALLELLGPAHKSGTLAEQLRAEAATKNLFNYEIFYKLVEALDAERDKEFHKARTILKFLSKSPTEAKPLATILNYLRIDPYSLEESADVASFVKVAPNGSVATTDQPVFWAEALYQAQLFFILEEHALGLTSLKMSMNLYKDHRLDSPHDHHLYEIFILFSCYLFREKDFKSGIHYLKEASKLKNQAEDLTSYSLMKIQLYIFSLKHLKNSADQHDILMNIIKGFISKISDHYALKIIVCFVSAELTKEYAQKLLGNLLDEDRWSDKRPSQNVIDNSKAKRGTSADKFSHILNKTPRPKASSVIKKGSLQNFCLEGPAKATEEYSCVTVLSKLDALFKDKSTTQQHLSSIEQLTEPFYLSGLLPAFSYCRALNQLIFFYLDTAEIQKVTALLNKIFDQLYQRFSNSGLAKHHFAHNEAFCNLFISMVVINDHLKAVNTLESWQAEHLLQLADVRPEAYTVPVNRFLIRHYIERKEIFLASSALDRLLLHLSKDGSAASSKGEVDQLIFLKGEISKLSNYNITTSISI